MKEMVTSEFQPGQTMMAMHLCQGYRMVAPLPPNDAQHPSLRSGAAATITVPPKLQDMKDDMFGVDT